MRELIVVPWMSWASPDLSEAQQSCRWEHTIWGKPRPGPTASGFGSLSSPGESDGWHTLAWGSGAVEPSVRTGQGEVKAG